jgi:ATP-binding cassette subfamily B protein
MFLLAVVSTLGFVFFLSYANPMVVAMVVDRVSSLAVDAAAGAPGAQAAASGAQAAASGGANGGGAGAQEVLAAFGPFIVLLIGANVLGQFFSKLQDYTVWKLELRANYALATQVFDTLSDQSMTFHSNRYGGSLVSQTQKFIGGYATLLESLVYAVIPIISAAVFTVSILMGLVPLYASILVVLLVVYVVVAFLLFRRILPLNEAAADAQNALSGELSDGITNILSVKTYGREAYERTLFDEANRRVLAADSKRMRASIARGAATSSLIVVIMSLVVVFITGGNAWFGISPGTLVMMFTYTYSLTMHFNRLNITFAQINRGFGDAHGMTAILDEPRLVSDVPNARELVVTKGAIRFEDMTFWYADASEEEQVFKGFNLEIPAGQRVGLVGKSGSGKTTLTTLLLRLSNLQAGRILVDGQDIACATQVSLRSQIGYVPQEPLLFHRTIRENIAYGKPDASEEEIRAAARKANALEFIEALPHGLETKTGERGVKLSGGQRQRIAIARAILAAAPILVLDEATSALDSESEKLIQDALKNLMEGRTSIVVAHRLSTVASLDRIVVLSEGRIVEDGTHAQLIAAKGSYARLWERQTGAFLQDE